MSFYKLCLLLIVLCLVQLCATGYVYPLWNSDKPEQIRDNDGDATVTEFIFLTLILPIREGFCNICANFLEVYVCLLKSWGHFEDESMTSSQTYYGQMLDMLRLKKPSRKVLPSCSPYAILVVSTTLMVFLGMVFVTKKLVEHVKDEDSLFRNIFHKSKSRCPCQENNN